MKKIFLSVVGFSIICRFGAYAQLKQDTGISNKPTFSLYKPVTKDSSGYTNRSLRVDEIDFVSSYYSQNGDHSPVTGGIGSERVTDIANSVTLNLVWFAKSLNKNTLSTSFGFDYHTAASQAWVSATGASSKDGTRIYPSVDWTTENAKTGNTFGIGAYYSGEYNYQSLGADMHFSLKTPDKNGEFGAKLTGYFDHVKLIYPSEFIPQPVISSGGTVITTASGNTIS